MEDASASSLHGFVQDCIEPGSTVQTDGWVGYSGLQTKGYDHEITPLCRKPKQASKLLPRVHRVASLLKRWLLRTHQGALSHQHLMYSLDECTFRFNRRKSANRGKLFFRLIEPALATAPEPYHAIVQGAQIPQAAKAATQPVGAS